MKKNIVGLLVAITFTLVTVSVAFGQTLYIEKKGRLVQVGLTSGLATSSELEVSDDLVSWRRNIALTPLEGGSVITNFAPTANGGRQFFRAVSQKPPTSAQLEIQRVPLPAPGLVNGQVQLMCFSIQCDNPLQPSLGKITIKAMAIGITLKRATLLCYRDPNYLQQIFEMPLNEGNIASVGLPTAPSSAIFIFYPGTTAAKPTPVNPIFINPKTYFMVKGNVEIHDEATAEIRTSVLFDVNRLIAGSFEQVNQSYPANFIWNPETTSLTDTSWRNGVGIDFSDLTQIRVH